MSQRTIRDNFEPLGTEGHKTGQGKEWRRKRQSKASSAGPPTEAVSVQHLRAIQTAL